ncbi:protein of unknown function [Desulfovibrio sp. 86]|nr:protein of unknown function [Desulfovibrio sp. 86]
MLPLYCWPECGFRCFCSITSHILSVFSYELCMLYYSQFVGIKVTKILGILMRTRKCTYDQFHEKVSRNCKKGVDRVVTW